MRVFIAIDLPSYIKEKISCIAAALKGITLDARWVKQENLHLTLKFLGEVKEDSLDRIKNILEETAAQFIPFKLGFKELGFFPNAKRPRVFFISTDKEEILKDICQTLEDKLERAGFPKEGRFKSHITLARLKTIKNINLLAEESRKYFIEDTFIVRTVILFKSTLTREGPIYEEIFKANLRS